MKEAWCFYIDDSGSRDPDKKFAGHAQSQDWFALGGIMIREADTVDAKAATMAFRGRWPEMKAAPLHSYDVRNRSGGFRWLADLNARRKNLFYDDLTSLIVGLPIHVLACVIDRPGYNNRYCVRYGPRRWKLCKTAFSIAVERAAKFAASRKGRLRVFVERTDRVTEGHLRGYYDEMRKDGLPFDGGTSAKYGPLTADELRKTLLEFDVKTKRSDLMQIADLVLWPVCKGGYDGDDRAYRALRDNGKLLEAVCTPRNRLHGTKYSCFDVIASAATQKQKPA